MSTQEKDIVPVSIGIGTLHRIIIPTVKATQLSALAGKKVVIRLTEDRAHIQTYNDNLTESGKYSIADMGLIKADNHVYLRKEFYIGKLDVDLKFNLDYIVDAAMAGKKVEVSPAIYSSILNKFPPISATAIGYVTPQITPGDHFVFRKEHSTIYVSKHPLKEALAIINGNNQETVAQRVDAILTKRLPPALPTEHKVNNSKNIIQ